MSIIPTFVVEVLLTIGAHLLSSCYETVITIVNTDQDLWHPVVSHVHHDLTREADNDLTH